MLKYTAMHDHVPVIALYTCFHAPTCGDLATVQSYIFFSDTDKQMPQCDSLCIIIIEHSSNY